MTPSYDKRTSIHAFFFSHTPFLSYNFPSLVHSCQSRLRSPSADVSCGACSWFIQQVQVRFSNKDLTLPTKTMNPASSFLFMHMTSTSFHSTVGKSISQPTRTMWKARNCCVLNTSRETNSMEVKRDIGLAQRRNFNHFRPLLTPFRPKKKPLSWVHHGQDMPEG